MLGGNKMDFKYYKPRIVVSKCLGFCNCRFDGAILHSSTIEKLRDYAEIVTYCPETEIGLPTPREALRMIRPKGAEELSLVTSYSGDDYTDKMRDYAEKIVTGLSEIDGFVLKNRSPSCGIKDVKVYPSSGKVMIKEEKAVGFFALEAQKQFANSIFEDDGRLTNFNIREHFLTAIFTKAHWRDVVKSGEYKRVVEFQSNYKYLFMSLSPDHLKKLGKIVSSHNKGSFTTACEEYESVLSDLLKVTPTPGKIINVIQHIFGYFSKHLSEPERELFLDLVGQYKAGRIPLSVIRYLLYSYAKRFNEEYILTQRFFAPYPETMISITDSGKGR